MNEHDAMKRLAAANPVRAESLETLLAPTVPSRTTPRRRLVLAAAVLLVLLAATATVSLVLHPSGSRSRASTSPRGGAYGVTPNPEVPIPLADATAALGAPVVLPQTSLIGPSDVGSVTKECPGPWGKTCAITIRFFVTGSAGPTGNDAATGAVGPMGSGDPIPYGVQIRYSLGGYSDPLPEYEGEGGGSKIVHLSGTPALYIPQDPKDTVGTASYMEFQLNGLTISVVARRPDGPTARSIAQSIIDRSQS